MATKNDKQDTNANPSLAEALTDAAAAARKPGVSTTPDPNARKEFAGGPVFGGDEITSPVANYDGNFVAMPVYLVECKAGLDWVPQQVFEFEIPFLERKFPDGIKIKSASGGEVDTAEDAEPFAELDLPDDAVVVFEQMRRKHNTPRHQGLVEELTGGVGNFAEVTGLTYNRRTKAEAETRALVKTNPKPQAKGKPQVKGRKR